MLLVSTALLHCGAQSGSGVIAGIVKDTSGGAIPGAQVMVVNEETNVAVSVTTNQEGLYRVGSLIPGSYRVEVRAEGFAPSVLSSVALVVGQTLAIDIALELTSKSEAVTVTADLPLVESQNAEVAQNVTRDLLVALPLPNRAASSLASLAPGVIMLDTGAGTAENYPVFTVAGGRVRNQEFILDGGNATNAVGLTRAQQLISLPVDAMQEFRVISNNYAAEYGHSTGGVITMSTRSGGNELHGSIFESFRNDALDAKNFFAASKPKVRLNQFGGSAGGPIRKNKTFVFGSWEQTRQIIGQPVASTVPTLLNRQGDFSDLRDLEGNLIVIYDPATKLPFPGNRIPADRMDPVARNALAYYPLPNRIGSAANAINYVGNSNATLKRDIVVARLDHSITQNDRLTVRYYINNSGSDTTGTFGNPASDPLSDWTSTRIQGLLGAYTHIFKTTVVNELRLNYLRRRFIDTRPGMGANLAAAIGLAGVSDAAFPNFNIPGYAPLSSSSVARYQSPITDRQVMNVLSWSEGRHAFKYGFEVRAGGNAEMRDRGSSGVFAFSPLYTSNSGAANTGNALATFLLGAVSSASVQTSDRIVTRAQYAGLFVQDDWRATDRLTLNYGLRYDIEFPREEVNNRMNSFDTSRINPISGTAGVVTFAGIDAPRRAFRTDTNNFGPRIGFAYQLTGSGKTVLRGGAGVFYGQTVSATIGDAASLGFSTSASYRVSQPINQIAFQLSGGFPAFARPALNAGFGAVPLGQKPTTAVAFFKPDQVAPTSYQMNVNLQHELISGMAVEMGYVGNIGIHVLGNDLSLNQVPENKMGPGNTQILRPFPQFSDVTWINPAIGRSTYHAGYIKIQKRFADRLSVLAHYTFSRFMDNVTSTDEYGSLVSYMNAYDRAADWGRSGSDIPHRFIATVLYELPKLGAHRLISAMIGSWKIGLMQTAQSGAPFTVTTAADTTNAFPAGPLRPDLIGNPLLPAEQRTPGRWFNTAAFVNPAAYRFGNSPRSVLRGPGFVSSDVTFEKTYTLTERYRLDLRSESYNLLNRKNFNIPGSVLGASDFGVISSAKPARTIQLGARLNF